VTDGRHEVGDHGPFRRDAGAYRGSSTSADSRVAWTWRPTPRRPTTRSNPRGREGSRGRQPHGREWLKQVTESGGDQAVKVVGNGAGGASREWNPATRRGVGGLEQSRTSQTVCRYSSKHRLGLVGSRIPRIERVGGASNPTGGGGRLEHGGRAPYAGRSRELRTRSSRVSVRPRAASHRTG